MTAVRSASPKTADSTTCTHIKSGTDRDKGSPTQPSTHVLYIHLGASPEGPALILLSPQCTVKQLHDKC